MSNIISSFNQNPITIIETTDKPIHVFDIKNENIEISVVESFGEEWKKFQDFSDNEINRLGEMYFDILDDSIINENTYGIDIGCGTGRWTRFLAPKVRFMEVIDPSKAIFSANKLLSDCNNVRLSIASTDNIPFHDNTFDFAMSIGVLHHIPNTQKAMNDCVRKVKMGGYFYTYLYYSLDNKGFFFKFILYCITPLRYFISRMPSWLKKLTCDIIALLVYMPIIIFGRILKILGLNKWASKLPLSIYQEQTFFVVRNDALDRFGTSLEQRFSKVEIETMMKNAGLDNILISENLPYWHAVGKKVR